MKRVRHIIETGPRYLLVSGACFSVTNLSLIGMASARVNYVSAVIVTTALMIPFSYSLHSLFTYRVKASFSAIWRYALSQAMNAPLAILLYYVSCNLAGMSMMLATPVVTVLMVIWNYATSYWSIVLNTMRRAIAVDRQT